MSKERTSLSLDPEVNGFLQQEHVNASGLVNQLVKQHMNGGAGEDVIREFRLRQLESELDELQSREEQKRAELEKLREIDNEREDEFEEKLAEAREVLVSVPKDPSNPAIQNWADELGLSTEELITELEEDDE